MSSPTSTAPRGWPAAFRRARRPERGRTARREGRRRRTRSGRTSAAARSNRWRFEHWSGERWWRIGGLFVLAVLAYVPALAVRPGVSPRTRRRTSTSIRRSSSARSRSSGTRRSGSAPVTHEYIGYLLPMGPFYVVFHLLGVPVWVAQRLWLGSLLFVAGAGILYLCRVLGPRGARARWPPRWPTCSPRTSSSTPVGSR